MMEIQELLFDAACELTRGLAVPIDVVKLAKDLGTSIVRSGIPPSKALLTSATGRWEIHLPPQRAQSHYSVLERFQIAHELGHFLLIRAGVRRPLGAGEYWQREALCDVFARRLLLPDQVVKRLIDRSPRTPQQRLGASAYIADVALVTWPSAAHRVTEVDPTVVFLRIGQEQQAEKGRKFRVNVSTIPMKTEQKRGVKGPLVNILQKLPQQSGFLRLDISLLSAFPSLRNALEAVAARVSWKEWRIAVTLCLDRGAESPSI